MKRNKLGLKHQGAKKFENIKKILTYYFLINFFQLVLKKINFDLK